ncbi:MAG: protein kinase [candidate division WOR-3 bacterium]
MTIGKKPMKSGSSLQALRIKYRSCEGKRITITPYSFPQQHHYNFNNVLVKKVHTNGRNGVSLQVVAEGSPSQCFLIKIPLRPQGIKEGSQWKWEEDTPQPQIIPIRGIGGIQKGRKSDFCIISEYIEGITLKKYLEMEETPKDLEAVLVLAKRLADGLRELKQLGLVHIDIKPDNIMIPKEGEEYKIEQARIIDLGMAVHVSDPDFYFLNYKFAPAGFDNYNYLAPEVVIRECPVYASDVYSWGAVVYEMMRGVPPREIKVNKLTKSAVRASFKNMVTTSQRVNFDEHLRFPPLDKLLERALNPIPNARPTADELVTGLEKLRLS